MRLLKLYLLSKRKSSNLTCPSTQAHNYFTIVDIKNTNCFLLCRYYGWRSFLFKDGVLPVHALTPIQYYTKTQLIVNDSLPSFYMPFGPAAEYHAQRLRPQIEEMLVTEYHGIR